MRASDDNRSENGDACQQVAEIAAQQRGLITHGNLVELGLSRWAIDRRRRSGYLRQLHPGVYAVGHTALPPLAREQAAVLTCAPNAYLSHHSAAAVWGMIQLDSPIHVSVVGRNTGPRAGIVVHRARHLDTTERHGIPITTPAATLIALAKTLSPLLLGKAFDEARTQGLISPQTLADTSRCPGAAALRALASDDRGRGISREGTEQLMLGLIRKAGLPAPDRNVRLGRWSIDMYWRAQRVAVELDSYGFHTTRGAFERDHEKDHVLRAHDIDLLRFTWHQVHGQPEQTLVRLATALARPRRAA